MIFWRAMRHTSKNWRAIRRGARTRDSMRACSPTLRPAPLHRRPKTLRHRPPERTCNVPLRDDDIMVFSRYYYYYYYFSVLFIIFFLISRRLTRSFPNASKRTTAGPEVRQYVLKASYLCASYDNIQSSQYSPVLLTLAIFLL